MDSNSTTDPISCNASIQEAFWERYEFRESVFYERHQPAIITISKISPPFWWCLGLVGNFISICVWLQPKMRHASGYYLAALAVFDILFIMCNIVYEATFIYGSNALATNGVCQLYAMVSNIVYCMSPALVLAFTAERYASVCHPFNTLHGHKNGRTSGIVITGLFCLFTAINSAYGYFYEVLKSGCSGRQQCFLRQEVMADPYFAQSYQIFVWTTEMVLFALVPLIVLILNAFVVREISRLSRVEQRNGHGAVLDRRASTVTLLGVSFYHMSTILPMTLIYSLTSYFTYGSPELDDEAIQEDPVWRRHLNYMLARTIIQQLTATRFAANFVVYFVTGKRFRTQLQEMFVACCKTQVLPTLSSRPGSRMSNTLTSRFSFSITQRPGNGSFPSMTGPGNQNKTPPDTPLSHPERTKLLSTPT